MSLAAEFVEVKLVTKAQVNYRQGSTKQHCGKCGNFKSPSTCAVVKGKVSSGMLCDLFWNRGRVPGRAFIRREKPKPPEPPPEEPSNGEEPPPNGDGEPPNGDGGTPTEGAVYGRKPPKPTSAWLLSRFIGRKSTDSKVAVIDMGKGQEYEFRYGEADQWPKEARRTGLTQLKQASWEGWWKLYLARRKKYRSKPDGKWKDPLGEAIYRVTVRSKKLRKAIEDYANAKGLDFDGETLRAEPSQVIALARDLRQIGRGFEFKRIAESVEHRDDGYYVHTPGGRTLGPFDTRTQAGMEDMFWINGADAGDEDELFGEARKRYKSRDIELDNPKSRSSVEIKAMELRGGGVEVETSIGTARASGHFQERRTEKQYDSWADAMKALDRYVALKKRKGWAIGKDETGSFIGEAEPGQGEEPADGKLARKLAKQALGNKASIALAFRQLWRHKYVKHNYNADEAWKLFYWATTHDGAGGKGFNPATRKAAAKLMVSAFSRWAKADMKAKVKRADGVTEKPVGEISRAEFVKWFMGSAPAISESGLHEQFVRVEHGRKPRIVQPKKPEGDTTEFDLGVRIAREQGQTFKTGQPVEFRFMHNDERAPDMGGRFQQDIEPSGYYMTTAPDDRTIKRLREAGQKFTIGTAVFRNPLVLDWGMAYDKSSWKYRLWSHYGEKKRGLTRALRRDGYDGIVTVRMGMTSEIVALKGKPKVTESMSGMFVEEEGDPKPPKPKKPPKKAPDTEPEDDELEMSDLEKEEEKAEKLGYELKDVQAYYDMQIASGLDQGAALVKTKKKFKVRVLKVSPTGKIMSDTIPDPEKLRKKQASQAPPPPPPEEPAGGGGGGEPTTGGTFPEGPRGPSGPTGPQGPPTPGGAE